MINAAELTPNELRQAGLDALVRELGPEGAIRFIQQFDPGKGDYTAERTAWLPDDVETILKEMREMRGELDSV